MHLITDVCPYHDFIVYPFVKWYHSNYWIIVMFIVYSYYNNEHASNYQFPIVQWILHDYYNHFVFIFFATICSDSNDSWLCHVLITLPCKTFKSICHCHHVVHLHFIIWQIWIITTVNHWCKSIPVVYSMSHCKIAKFNFGHL